MDERIAGQLTLLSFYRRYVIAETLTVFKLFEHKIGIFVLGRRKSGIGKRNHGDAFASFFPMVVPKGLLP